MRSIHTLARSRPGLTGVLFLLGICAARPQAADELQLRARLIWGANNPKPAEVSDFKPVDNETAEKLGAVFKWMKYFEVSREQFSVPVSNRKRVRMSDKCVIEVENLGESSVEVKLHGRGKMVLKKRQRIKEGELLVLAGDDKNDTAWFVVITRQEP